MAHFDQGNRFSVMHEVGMLRLPLAFGRAHADITLSENGTVAEKRVSDSYWRTAASKVVMWSGRHFAQFTVLEGQIMFFGAIRPAWDVERGANCQQDGCC